LSYITIDSIIYITILVVDMKALCYDELGCYSINPPWTDDSRPVSQFPQSPDYIRPQFCLYTRYNPNHCQELKYNESQTVYKSFLVPTHKIYFIAHGFLENGEKPWMRVSPFGLFIGRLGANKKRVDVAYLEC
jgi:hypothetical protein